MPAAKYEVKFLNCKICGHSHIYRKDKETGKPLDSLPDTCRRCGIRFDEAKFVTIHDAEASPTTHITVRWSCRACKSHGIAWSPRNATKVKRCPNCGIESNPGVFSAKKVPSAGRCGNLWSSRTVPKKVRAKPKKVNSAKVVICPACGYSTTYVVVPPMQCRECGCPMGQENVQD